ncbi:hypothetical protein I4U23_004086 [Adineta vaga]|nr:hypothetical protein I4U23_004086 [Adineta vaga]
MSRTVLITGAAQGIGRAIAIRLAKDGFNIAVNDIQTNSSKLTQVQKQVEHLGRRSLAVIGDVSQDKDVERMMKTTQEKFGSLNVVIANAGICQVKPFIDITTEDWDRMFAINMRGVFLCYREAAKIMIEQKQGGKIIGACSSAGYVPFPMLSHYSTTKWGIRGLTQAAALELAKYNITVNAYCPGITETAMWNMIDEQVGKSQGIKKREFTNNLIKSYVALDRTGKPEDIANFVSFLASTNSDYMTGQNVLINGGAVLS